MEYFGAWQWVSVILAGAIFMTMAVAFMYVAFRFLLVILTLDSTLVREFKFQSKNVESMAKSGPIQEEKLKSFIQSRMAPTDGEFVPQSDEEAFIKEQTDFLRSKGMTDEELEAFVRQAVSDNVGKE